MKTTIIARIILIFGLLFTFSCSKDKDVEEVRFRGTMEAKINGELIKFDDSYGYGFFDLDLKCNKLFHQIYGGWEFNASDGHVIVLNFHPSQGIGTYNSHGTYLTWVGEYNNGNNIVGYNQFHFNGETQTHIEDEGSVILTSTTNGRYKGTFFFTAVNENGSAANQGLSEKVVITEGKFEIVKEGIDTLYPLCID